MTILEHLLESPIDRPTWSTPEPWWAAHEQLVRRWPATVDLALAGGLAADRPAWAFASGYQAALSALLPDLDGPVPTALCATEERGAHPRAIETTLRGDRLAGTKTFVTLGAFARRLVVVAREGQGTDGRPRLRVALVDSNAGGVAVRPGPVLPFVPEMPHAVVLLDCQVIRTLPGDGYARFLKPFRTIEDLHVHAALVGWLLRVGRGRWSPGQVERGLTVAAAARGLEGADPSAPATWRALGGLLELAAGWIEALDSELEQLDEHDRRRWKRDRAILGVAGRARATRLARAREQSGKG